MTHKNALGVTNQNLKEGEWDSIEGLGESVENAQDCRCGEAYCSPSNGLFCVASSNNDPQFHSFLDKAITDLIG